MHGQQNIKKKKVQLYLHSFYMPYGVDRHNFNFYLLIIPNFNASFKTYLYNRTYWISYMILMG